MVEDRVRTIGNEPLLIRRSHGPALGGSDLVRAANRGQQVRFVATGDELAACSAGAAA